MTLWHIVLLASILCVAIKLAGYLVPATVLATPMTARAAELVTVSLLAALIAVQTLGAGQAIVLDARVPALGVAAILFAIRVPFVIVVFAAAVVAAAIRALT